MGIRDELRAFGINSTIGLLGFRTPAKSKFDIEYHIEDLGQTIATYGIGYGSYVVWPLIGPSSIRDSVGMIGDSFLNPTRYLPRTWNITSFTVIN